MSMPTTRPSGTPLARARESQPEPQPTSRIFSSGAICVSSRTGLVMGQCSCSIDSPLPASAQRLNSSRSCCRGFVSGMKFRSINSSRDCLRYAALGHGMPCPYCRRWCLAPGESEARLPSLKTTSLLGGGLLWLAFVCGWAVESGHRDIVEAIVDAELGAMVDQVVHDHAAEDCGARHGENGLAVLQQSPQLHELFVGGAGEAGASLLCAFVEDGENFFAILAVGHFNLLAAWSDVEIIGLKHRGSPAGHHSNVIREPAQGSGFGVRLPVPLVIGDSFEGFAGVGKFLINFS